jgi:hypothetical protein
MRVSESELAVVPGLVRVENTAAEEVLRRCQEDLRPTYRPGEIWGDYCTLHTHIECPPSEVYDYLADLRSLEEYTASTREFVPVDDTGLWVGKDYIAEGTRIFARVVTNPDAMTVDYHCAWDQGEKLWMIYLFRVVPAELVLNRPGAVVIWTNCHHPYYDANPHPELAPAGRPWVGDIWHLFHPGHSIELSNLKAILEYRHAKGIPIVPSDVPERA